MNYLLAVLKGAGLFNALNSLFPFYLVIGAWGKGDNMTQEKVLVDP